MSLRTCQLFDIYEKETNSIRGRMLIHGVIPDELYVLLKNKGLELLNVEHHEHLHEYRNLTALERWLGD